MMFIKFRDYLMFSLIIFFIRVDLSNSTENVNSDPFAALGIPDLSPKKVMEELEVKKENKGPPTLKSMEDLPNFLKNTKPTVAAISPQITHFLIFSSFRWCNCN